MSSRGVEVAEAGAAAAKGIEMDIIAMRTRFSTKTGTVSKSWIQTRPSHHGVST